MKGLKIICVEGGSTGAEVGLEEGDELLSVNGKELPDELAYRFLVASDEVTLLVKKRYGGIEEVEIEKDEEDDLGLCFPDMRVKVCNNRCVFCFVAQMPAGFRKTLYVKDEDYRHSFMYGNYVTLTTLKDADYVRIIDERLSPLYVSVHTTDDEMRRFLLGNRKSPPIMDCVKRLTDGGISIHTQAVVCPGLNDGERLVKTVADLAALYPRVMSLAIVPVGLTSHRDGLYQMEGFTKEGAAGLLDYIEPMRRHFRKNFGEAFVYPSDEFYITAGRPLPKDAEYDGYPQIDNGVGLVRDFLTEFAREKKRLPKSIPGPVKAVAVTGVSFAPYLREAAESISPLSIGGRGAGVMGLELSVLPVVNRRLGETVTVTGLLCGADIADALKGVDADVVFIPSVAVRDGFGVFLDDLTPEDIERRTGVRVVMVEPTARGLVEAVKGLKRSTYSKGEGTDG